MKTIERILHTIKREGAVTAKQLANDLGITTMGARQHLQSLEKDGILDFYDVKVKVGRPTRHWALTQKGHHQFADRHGELTIQVIEAVEHLFGRAGLAKVTAEREAQTLAYYQSALENCDSLASKLATLVALREQEGYMAELEHTDSGFLLLENHCPICKAAKRCPALCQSELNIFQHLLGNDCTIERHEHIIAGQHRCAYRITPH
ncbi:winged helix-turn-helix transcriptional regulator [Vibrio sp. V27_P1S3P104]|uniref:helix-turn-helix transcriptional regulator n=1 Tax=unclassified Vibrio TaxID=2614977 RepID=UPI0013730546|nr:MULTISPECIES: metalloregulator ArsR/SmtB family transcription factor [unclassified Vibrio]NAW70736.1 winged helix-turn-helix transcriptional regulator [Vibrio sp. V28_P6S34P95]NAX05928.1 winged helix-turn-helix transcriptional regulator [Vibrio sp. V30_P3S12P165]NAX35605.1 winged helix-turn-helix transcriptional regulator [Vibrio sp. V29_P1S30P107]NAX37749.1 winged helix-turn-helix transcriptional regulator [Vibrio sp. V27_P1S3P104]NAX41011.1 winged helix-turn-helix transcriptional regulato